MIPAIDHIFLTRFNLPSAGVEHAIRAQEGWLRDRVELFESVCLPSLRQQSDHGFAWIIYFDPESPAWLRKWIVHVNEDRIFQAVFRKEVTSSTLYEDLCGATHARGGRLLTTNIDNDDGLAVDFVERAKQAAAQTTAPRQALYFTAGLIKRSDELYIRADKRNAFCSVVESWERPVSCWADWHNLLGRSMPVHEVSGPPAWLQVVHEHNVSNRVRGQRVSPVTYRPLFPGLLELVPTPGRLELLTDLVTKSLVRGVGESIRAAVKNILMRLFGKAGVEKLKVLIARTATPGVRN